MASATVIPLSPTRAASPAELQARSDDELMAMAKVGLTAAYEEIVRRYQGPARAFCTRMLGDQAAGDDAAQDLFVEIWRTRERYQGRSRFRSLLFTAARNHCISALRRRRREADPPPPEPIDPGSALDELLAVERRRRLEALVAQLPVKLRESVWLRFSAELPYDEIAEVLRRPEQTVRSRVFHALRRLRDLLGSPERSSL
jgi:RNA polymerase sigma-70 factor (ECF subfamily)